ncbi:MAG: hypothetical protein P4L74_02035 [Candidatus Doudnabacteria bacterium]|nr:hypothetical protein [Candidatus Doudnabacteria bacterium]
MAVKTITKKFVVTVFKQPAKPASAPTFFELAEKNAVKKRRDVSKNLSKNIDKIIYGT